MALILSYGAGTNSKALIVGLVERDIKPDHILFADTGGERPDTYAGIIEANEWLKSKNFPEIITVSENESLEENCLRRNALPGIAYGFKSCSEHYKIRPQKRWVRKNGIKDVKWIVGIDADEAWRAKYDEPWYPLIEWDWGRDECVGAIKRAGLTQPGKSSCYFCPSMRQSEIRALNQNYPDLIKRALAMEANADLTKVKGLGRSFAWADLLATDDMFPDSFNVEIACGCYDG
jgi:hypothetical protein